MSKSALADSITRLPLASDQRRVVASLVCINALPLGPTTPLRPCRTNREQVSFLESGSKWFAQLNANCGKSLPFAIVCQQSSRGRIQCDYWSGREYPAVELVARAPQLHESRV
jgi:hypothetical protein